MVRRVKTLFFVLIMAVGVMGGAPLDAAKAMGENEVCPMKCCEKMQAAPEKPAPRRTNFCRITSCTESIPSVPSTSSIVQVTADSDKTELQAFYKIVDSTRPKEVPKRVDAKIPVRSTPFYLKHNSLLI